MVGDTPTTVGLLFPTDVYRGAMLALNYTTITTRT